MREKPLNQGMTCNNLCIQFDKRKSDNGFIVNSRKKDSEKIVKSQKNNGFIVNLRKK